MSGKAPDFDELVQGADPGERARLERVHHLLLQVDAPPEVPPRLSAPPPTPVPAMPPAPSRRAPRLLALAAALTLTAFAVGVLVGDRLTDPGTFRVYALAGTASAPDASATIEVFDLDDAGNWPMELSVRGLRPTPDGGRYELWLTRDGEPAELCGSFLAEPDGTTVVPMNAPWRLDEFDGWLVVEEGSRAPVLCVTEVPEIRAATLVRAPRERVYDALTRAEELDAWFTSGAEVDARPGGEMVWRWDGWGPDRVTREDRGPVLEARRPERFVFRWQAALGGTTVEVDFVEHPEGTVVRLREHGYPDTPEGWEQFSSCATGWGEALTLLKVHVEHGIRY